MIGRLGMTLRACLQSMEKFISTISLDDDDINANVGIGEENKAEKLAQALRTISSNTVISTDDLFVNNAPSSCKVLVT